MTLRPLYNHLANFDVQSSFSDPQVHQPLVIFLVAIHLSLENKMHYSIAKVPFLLVAISLVTRKYQAHIFKALYPICLEKKLIKPTPPFLLSQQRSRSRTPNYNSVVWWLLNPPISKIQLTKLKLITSEALLILTQTPRSCGGDQNHRERQCTLQFYQ